LRSDLLGVELDGHVKFRAVVGLELLPAADCSRLPSMVYI
jgi:hypothetical protein